jgi:hypothetical protein
MGIARWEVRVRSRCAVQAACDDLVMSVQVAKRSAISVRSSAVSRWRRGRKYGEITLNNARNRWGCARGAEAFNGAFALPGGLVRVFRPVEVPRLAVLDRRHHRPMRHLIASELVGDQHPRYPALLGQQLSRVESWRGNEHRR